MSLEESVLIKLIKQSQFGATESIDFSCVDMDLLYTEAVQQAVHGLVAAEIPLEYLSDKWIQVKDKQVFDFFRYCHAQDELSDLLKKNNIAFVVIKGSASAIYYRDPTLRNMGDIDILVSQESYDLTKKLLASSDYVEVRDNGRHSVFKKDKFIFEVHHHFSHEIDLENWIVNGLDNREHASIDGHDFPMLSKLANGLVLLDHFRRHLQAAIGLRQAIDWMMYVYRNLDDEFWIKYFKPVVQEKGMEKLAVTLTRMCQLYLGLPNNISWCNCGDEELCRLILDSTLSTGNFGSKSGAGKTIESVGVTFMREGFFSRLQHAGERNWGAYKSHHFLKPLCWIYQLLRYVLRGFKSGRTFKQIKSDNYRSKKRYELIQKLMSQ